MTNDQENELENRTRYLSSEVTAIQGGLRAMAADYEVRMATERFNVEPEIMNSSKLTKDLQQEKKFSEHQRYELQEFDLEVNSLQQGNNVSHPNEAEVLAKLFQTQYELAYAHAEVMT